MHVWRCCSSGIFETVSSCDLCTCILVLISTHFQSNWRVRKKQQAVFSSFEWVIEHLFIIFLFVSSKPATQAAYVTVMYGQFKTYIFYACILYFVAFTRAKHFRKEKSLCIYHYFCVVLHWMFYASFFPLKKNVQWFYSAMLDIT